MSNADVRSLLMTSPSLSTSMSIDDMALVDADYHKNLEYVLNSDDVEALTLCFEMDDERFGEVISTELKPGGASIAVTNENKHEYVNLVCKRRFVDKTREQMSAMIKGFNAVVPTENVAIFDAKELELLVGGIHVIDVHDWKINTRYTSGYHAASQAVIWFWESVVSFDDEMRARVLQFATGTSRVPMNGFAELHGSDGPMKFTVKCWGPPSMHPDEYCKQLPRAHTCFNRVDLPPYTSYQMLREKLVQAVTMADGFDGVD